MESKKALSKALRDYVQVNCFSVQTKVKTHWLASNVIPNNVLHKSITLKNLLSVGMGASNI